MSISGIGSNPGVLNLMQPTSGSNQGSIEDLLENKADTSGITGITNIDSYVKSSLMSGQIESTYKPPAQPNPFNVANIAGALNAMAGTVNLNSIDNLDEYVNEIMSESQLNDDSQLTAMGSKIGNPAGILNLDQSVGMAAEEVQNGLAIDNGIFSGITDMGGVLDSVYNTYKNQAAKSSPDTSSVIDKKA